jgi:8-oxo-dGTP pyrophosphatase MutT (NUDIX family)
VGSRGEAWARRGLDLKRLESKLRTALAGPLPGTPAQLPLAPRPRFGWTPGEWPSNCRHGGALLLLYPRDAAPHVLLTVRDADLQHHAGQVSLPGGSLEPGESHDQAALREATEEVGLDPQTVRLLGALTPLHVPVSRFVVHPRVGVTDRRPGFRPRPGEVARVLEVPLAHLEDPACLGVERRQFDRNEVEVPFFRVDGERVWGATAMVLAEFLTVVGTPPDPWL